MDEFLNDLRALMEQHNATILRSADDEGTLVVCVQESDGTFVDAAFDADIDSYSLRHGRHQPVVDGEDSRKRE